MLVGLVALVATVSCAPPPPLDIGFVGGISGRVADLGVGGRDGVLLAIEQRNARGGIAGRPVRLLVEDDRQDPERARRVLRTLLERGVVAIIGPMTSAMAVAMVPLINEAGVVAVSPTTTTDRLDAIDDQFFRVVSSSRSYSTTHARYQYEALGLRRIAAIQDRSNRAYTERWLAGFREVFEGLGGELVASIPFDSGPHIRFTDLAEEAIAARPDGVLIVASALDTALICQQIRKLDPGIPLSTTEWASTEKLIDLGGNEVEGILISQFFDRASQDPDYLRFKSAYRDRFLAEPGFPAVAGFDAANAVLDALAAQREHEGLKATLLRIGSFAGAQGRVEFDRYGDSRRLTYLTRVVGGEFRVIKQQ